LIAYAVLFSGAAATGTIPGWCWPLWLLLAMHAARIFTVHAPLEAREAGGAHVRRTVGRVRRAGGG
jgi:hypothetical protein